MREDHRYSANDKQSGREVHNLLRENTVEILTNVIELGACVCVYILTRRSRINYYRCVCLVRVKRFRISDR